MKQSVLKIYFAGDLFDSKDLGGNLMLADAVNRVSNGKYLTVLPQNGECEVFERSSQTIRDNDFLQLIDCDLIVANFDGTDLDSGTVVEFCFAKMLDIPAVLLRTDFRNSGDHTLPDGSPWNLMCSHFPRTSELHINSMMLYHEYKNRYSDHTEMLHFYYQEIASKITAELDDLLTKHSWLSRDEVLSQYHKTILSMGGTVKDLLPPDKVAQIVQRKTENGIY